MNLEGLTSEQAAAKLTRQRQKTHKSQKSANSTGRIILKNTLTIFNLVNLVLAVMILIVGSYKNLLFIVVAIANTLISITNELRAKQIVDQMKLMSEQKPTVIRDGKPRQIPTDQIVEGDLLILSIGDQIPADAKVEQGSIEVNESLLTGEQDNIAKHEGDPLISGSFIVSGTCKATITTSPDKGFIGKLEKSARTIKTADSKLFTILNLIVKYISFALIPIGVLLLLARFRVPDTTPEVAVTTTVAALISMIPEGLVLLTSSVLALATIRLSEKQVLVQDLYSVETLARVDCICLDKTGTLTTGNMTVKDFMAAEGQPQNTLQDALELILGHSEADNATSTALKKALFKSPFSGFKSINSKPESTKESNKKSAALKNRGQKTITASFSTGKNHTSTKPSQTSTDSPMVLEAIPFSSDRKYSGIRTKDAEYLMGALEFMTDNPDFLAQERAITGNYRIISVIKRELNPDLSAISEFPSVTTASAPLAPEPSSPSKPSATPASTKKSRTLAASVQAPSPRPKETLLGFALLEDELRKDATNIINFFTENNVEIKVISGDNLKTVQAIAQQVGVPQPAPVDLSTLETPINYDKLVQTHNIFTRVTPGQKKSLVNAFQKQGKTVAMTGDGVNDILAMKEADCSIAIGEGSDAARRSAKIVLLDSDFAAVPQVIAEGRQSINNLERSATLFLTKTVYAAILAVIFAIVPIEYPFSPISMSLLNTLCIGLPGLLLALEPNTARIKNQFMNNIKRFSIPTGIVISIATFAISIIGELNNFSRPLLLTISVITVFALNYLLLCRISRPFTKLRFALLAAILAGFLFALLVPFSASFFDFLRFF